MEKFTRECLEMDARSSASSSEASARMDQVYARAAQLITTTLDMDGCFILDIGQFELVEITTEQGKQSRYRADPYSAGDQDPVMEMSETFGPVNALPILASTVNTAPTTRTLTPEEHQKMSDFLLNNRDGRIFENVAPSWIRYMFPPELRYGMGKCLSSTQRSTAYIQSFPASVSISSRSLLSLPTLATRLSSTWRVTSCSSYVLSVSSSSPLFYAVEWF